MKLDRNTNPRGRGKYALVNMRKLGPLIEGSQNTAENFECIEAYFLLKEHGFITEGNESPGDQFFVMKYRDRFTAAGLNGYATAVELDAAALENNHVGNPQSKSLREYAQELR